MTDTSIRLKRVYLLYSNLVLLIPYNNRSDINFQNLTIFNSVVDGFISLVELFGQWETDNVVVSHNCNSFVLFFVLFQHLHHAWGPSSQVCRSLINEGFFHVFKDRIQYIQMLFAFMRSVYLLVLLLVLLTLVAEKPEVPQLLNPREVILRKSFLFALDGDTTITRASQPFRKHRLDDDWTFLSSEDLLTGRQCTIQGRDQDKVWLVLIELLPSFTTLNKLVSTCSYPWGVIGGSTNFPAYLTSLRKSLFLERCSQS